MGGEIETETADALLDVSGLTCPLPVLKARRRMRDLPDGAVLMVRATDPMSRIDIPHFCNVSGNTLLDTVEEGDVLVFRIAKRRFAPSSS